MLNRIWKFLKFLFAFAFLVFTASLMAVALMAEFGPKITKAEAIIVLGAAINTPALTSRSLEGLRLYKEGKAPVIVLSGGRISAADISEAGFMQKVIKKNSSTTPSMILEEQSHSTYENIKNSKALLPQAQSVVVVSDKFHLARAALLAKRAGFKKVYWSGPEPSYYKTTELAYYYLREAVALIFYLPKIIKN